MREEEEHAEEDGQARAAEVLVLGDPDRMVGCRVGAVILRERVAVRIAIGDEEQVRPVLDPVAEAVDAKVAKAARHSADGQDREPGQERNDADDADAGDGVVAAPGKGRPRRDTESAAEDEAGIDQDEPEAGLPAVLGLRGGILGSSG